MKLSKYSTAVPGVLALGAIAFSALPALAGSPTDFLYVGDYYTGNLLKYDASGNPVGGQPFIANPQPGTNNGIKEGVHGTANTIITVTGSTITRYTNSGKFINNVSTGFQGIGNMAITPDAKFVYVPDESGNTLYKVDVATGAHVAQVALSGAHDVAISGNYVYASGYTHSTGVVRYDLDLTPKSATQIILNNDNGLSRPSGISIDPKDGSLWINQNSPYANITQGSTTTQPASGGVWHYKLVNGTWTFDKKTTSSMLQFAFGSDFGPDGKLYIATLGDFHVRNTGQYGSNPDYHNGVYTYDPTTNVIASFLTTGAFDGHDDAAGPGGITGPKYIKWSNNFATANDPGVVPEPNGLAIGATFVSMLGGFLFLARRRAQA